MFASLLSQIFSNLVYLALHVTNAGSFPKPLSAEEERRLVTEMENGNQEARCKLIEHNLRLVAHIIKNGVSGRRIFPV